MAVLLFGLGAEALRAQTPLERIPIVLDTDIGSDIDDAFALALALASPELELRGITTVGKNTETRALFLCRFLTMTGRRHTPVVAGGGSQPVRDLGSQFQYYYHPDVLFNRTRRPEKMSAVEFLHGRVKSQPEKVTVVALGPLTNIAQLLTDKPECKKLIKRIVLTASEVNLRADAKAAQTVFASGVPLVVVPQKATAGLKLGEAGVRRVFSPQTALTQQVQAMYQLWDRSEPILADPLTVAVCFAERFCTLVDQSVQVDDRGNLNSIDGKSSARVVTSVRSEEFLSWYVERLASCLPPHRTPAKTVARGAMPHRVHVAEDFETDIERRWWMSGKAESRNLPVGSKRACRGVLTHDFDDLLGHSRQMYTAVIFNPVPGPPMGKNTRLSFRYFLSGTSSLRVQIYSLTNGYHRHLVLHDLPQGRWESATVDMTVARRPDGTGGPLSEGERIDDIQFYTEAKAELIIDDIVLYDASPEDEKRPFPQRIHFTAGFDTGKQGNEWPGNFEIVPDRGYFWKAARSVDNRDPGTPWLRVQLRGERPLGGATQLRFRYHLTGADRLRVALVNSTRKTADAREATALVSGKWAETSLDFTGKLQSDRVDEIHFLLPKGAEMLLDDVLLFEPGK